MITLSPALRTLPRPSYGLASASRFGLGQQAPVQIAVARTVNLTRPEAEAFAHAVTETIQYLAENMATARVFCPGMPVASMATLLASEAVRIQKTLAAGTEGAMLSVETLLAASRLSDCATTVTRHMDVVTGLALLANSLTILGGIFFDIPVLLYVGLAGSLVVQGVGPMVRIPLIE